MKPEFAAALLLLWPSILTWAFNLEPRIAIRKAGRKGTYFGLSVAPHQILASDRIESTLLVGAPLDTYGQETNRQRKHRQDQHKATGVLYKCPFTSRSRDCVKVEDVPTAKDWRSLQEAAGQWLGVAVNSQGPGKQVIVCAHRYVKNETDQRWGHGQCFTLTQELKHSATWDPCEGRAKNRAHEEWGFCQAGTSALLTDDQTALIGAPGPFTWRGTVFAVSVNDDFLFRDKTHYHTPVRAGEAPVDKYAYLGMSLAAGNFLPASRSCGHHLSYATGAPRAADVGAVLLFVKCRAQKMRVERSLSGEKFASSFGYTLASVDLNSDGFQDLLVGAPFYGDTGAVYLYMNSEEGLLPDEDRRKLLGTFTEGRFGFSLANAGDINNDGYGDVVIGAPYDGHGKVYVYLGRETHGLALDGKPDQILSAKDLPTPNIRTFGYSLGGGLDLDLNNHSDIVVGAFGSDSAFVIRSRPVIDVVTWFGENRMSYIDPTLLGCEADVYSTEVCFPVKSCFLIKNFPHNIESTHLRYALTAEVFLGGRRVSRVRFGDSSSNASHVSEKTVAVEQGRLTGCFQETAYLKEGTVDLRSPIRFQLKLRLQQDDPRPLPESAGVPNINQFPILNQREATKVLKVTFHKSCGSDDLCHSKLLASLAAGPGYDSQKGLLEIRYRQEVQLNVTVSNLGGEPAYSAELQVDIDPAFAYVGRSDDVSDIHCDYRGRGKGVRCKLGNPYASNRTDRLLFRVVPSHSSPFMPHGANFSVTTNTTSEDLGSAQDRVHKLQVRVIKRAELSMRSLVQPDQIWYGGMVRSESSMRIMSDIGSKLTHTFQVTNDGPWHVDELDVIIEWPFRLAPTEQTPNGKWLLYLAEPPEVTPPGSGTCYLNPRSVNALGLRDVVVHRPSSGVPESASAVLQKRRRRRRRSVNSNAVNNDIVQGVSYQNHHHWTQNVDSGSADVVLDCADDQVVQCHIFTCRLHAGLRANESAVVRVRSRVWNSTLVEEFGAAVKTVAVYARARLMLPEELDIHQAETDDDSTVAQLWAFPVVGDGAGIETVPTWIILVSVAVGLVVVCLIAYTLYKLGFFRRNRVPEDVMISAKVTSSAYGAGRQGRPDEYIS